MSEKLLPKGIIDHVSDGYDKLWQMFIKPEKLDYSIESLGPRLRDFDDCYYIRDDLEIKSLDNKKIATSFYYPLPRSDVKNFGEDFYAKHDFSKKKDLGQVPCLVYLHSQGGSRIEGNFLVEFCAKNGYALCLFDFIGSGHSEGEYVSLGIFERLQLECVVEQLRSWHNIGSIGIWGRSMGAVTGVLYAKNNSFQISAMVLDSPFTSITEMVQEVAYKHYKIPAFLVNMGIGIIKSSIKKRIGVDIFKLWPINHGKWCSAPALFIAGEQDGLVTKEKVKEFCDQYNSKKELKCSKQYISSEGNHHDHREDSVIETCQAFIKKQFTRYISNVVDSHENFSPKHGLRISIKNKKLDLRGMWLKHLAKQKKIKRIKEMKAKGINPKTRNPSTRSKNKLTRNKSMKVESKEEKLSKHKVPKLGQYDDQKAVRDKIAKGKLHFANSRAKTMEFDSKFKLKNEDQENFGVGTDEDYLKPQRLAYGNGNLGKNPKSDVDSAGLKVPEFKNNKSTLLRPNLLPASLTLQHNDYHTKNSSKSPNETGSTEAMNPSQNTQEFFDETLALDNYEVIAGDYDVFENHQEEDSILGDLNQLDQYLKGVGDFAHPEIKADNGIENINRPSLRNEAHSGKKATGQSGFSPIKPILRQENVVQTTSGSNFYNPQPKSQKSYLKKLTQNNVQSITPKVQTQDNVYDLYNFNRKQSVNNIRSMQRNNSRAQNNHSAVQKSEHQIRNMNFSQQNTASIQKSNPLASVGKLKAPVRIRPQENYKSSLTTNIQGHDDPYGMQNAVKPNAPFSKYKNSSSNGTSRLFFGGSKARKSSVSSSQSRKNKMTYGQSGGLGYSNKLNRSKHMNMSGAGMDGSYNMDNSQQRSGGFMRMEKLPPNMNMTSSKKLFASPKEPFSKNTTNSIYTRSRY